MVLRDESYWTRQLMEYLRKNRNFWLFYKLADHFTAGIPDIVIVGEGHTTWFELKVLKPGENIIERVKKDPLQFHDMCKIEDNGNPCWYIIFLPGDELRYTAPTPSFLRHSMSREHALNMQVHTDFSWIIKLVEVP